MTFKTFTNANAPFEGKKLAIDINKNFNPTVLVGIMRGAAPIIDILSRIFIFEVTTLFYQQKELFG